MPLVDQVNNDIKAAMKAREKDKLAALRAVKSALLLAATEKGNDGTSEEAEIKMLQKQVKQRKEAAAAYESQGRQDLAQEELDQAKVIEAYLPAQMSEDDVIAIIDDVIAQTGASSMKDMGKVMGMASGKLAGKADNKMVAQVVKSRLT
ncbi:MAG: glutamyl-tRNA amidotransferase [Crocinitomicaceae bacterium]|nr:glutamyl-tRNA amidotransferase [Crocinitomicaceae bacterium]|tara:strand:+ start:1408 stop:1854 length:447 start_codon:yes stop_codon:yes gene_type:complete